jgi:hypothetical protein
MKINALAQDDLQGNLKMSKDEMYHNNFGICNQM